MPKDVKVYLDEVVKIRVYLFGSASYNAYEPGLSDLNIQAVVKHLLKTTEKQQIIRHLNLHLLPCPATKIEFVVYAQNSVNPANRHPYFELNLNTGPHKSDHISLNPVNKSSHWFLFDIAMGRQLGCCLDVNKANSANSVLSACRSWQFIASGEFSSKLNGARWAMHQQSYPAVVEQAIAARKAGEELPAAHVQGLYAMVTRVNRASLETCLHLSRRISGSPDTKVESPNCLADISLTREGSWGVSSTFSP
ncbi:hypothetical protein DER44DRAFT_816950 [Fusarium oxysporum]|nr:hypothetical protein DER44DRAFT_816950 [Fusarium oxysporum]